MNKRRLKNNYYNYKRQFKKNLRRRLRKKFAWKKWFLFILSFFLLFFVVIVFSAFIFDFVYHKQTFQQNYWTVGFFACCGFLLQIRYFLRHKKLPLTDTKISNQNSSWGKFQIIVLNVLATGLFALIFGLNVNTLYTQVMGTQQPPKIYTVINKKIDKNSRGFDDYEIYIYNKSYQESERILELSTDFYQLVKVNDVLVLYETCSVLSCYIHEDDIDVYRKAIGKLDKF